jgi:hypothetical protein
MGGTKIPDSDPLVDLEEIEPPGSEVGSSRTRHCAELVRLLATEPGDLVEESIFKNRYSTALNFLTELADRRGLTDRLALRPSSLRGYVVMYRGQHTWVTLWKSCGQLPEQTRTGQVAALVRRIVGMTPSEAEVERVISIQCDIVGTKGTSFGQDVFTSRTQLRQD